MSDKAIEAACESWGFAKPFTKHAVESMRAAIAAYERVKREEEIEHLRKTLSGED